MITAALAGLNLYGLFCGRVPPLPLGLLCAAAALLLWRLHRHEHGGPLVIDRLAQRSRLGRVNAGFKAALCGVLLAECLGARAPLPPLCAAAGLAWAAVAWGGVPLRAYLRLWSVPASFLLLSGLALLAEFGPQPDGLLSVPFFGGFFCVTAGTQARAALVMARAFGGVACLYLLALTTPLPDLIAVLRRLRVPSEVADLMVLIYRYLFILLDTHRQMRDAAASRLGYASLRRSVRTTGALYGRLLAHSFRRAGQCFDAMESRCYEGSIRFLEREQPLRAREAAVGSLAAAVLLAAVWAAGKGGV